MSGKIPINISSRFPLHIEADADMFGQLFAAMGDDEQVAVLRAMVEHMRPHRMQWDYIAIEFEKPENAEVFDEFRSVLFPSYASSQAEIERLRGKLTNCVHALTFAINGWDESDPFIQKLRATRDGAQAALSDAGA